MRKSRLFANGNGDKHSNTNKDAGPVTLIRDPFIGRDSVLALLFAPACRVRRKSPRLKRFIAAKNQACASRATGLRLVSRFPPVD